MTKPLVVDQQWLDRIAEQVNGLQYGHVTITVHDGRIVQIDRMERTRYDSSSQKQVPSGLQQSSEPLDSQSKSVAAQVVKHL